MWLQGVIYCCLLAIAYFDFKIRAVYTWIFAFLGVCLMLLKMQEHRPVIMDEQLAVNFLFLFLQFGVLLLYFKIKTGKWGQIMDQKMGWGDVVFLLCIALYLPFLSFFAFYVVSLLIILVLTACLPKWRMNTIGIPLAGCQALLFALFLLLEKLKVLDWQTLLMNAINNFFF
ncbi:hypothetical protein GEO21_20645 [Sphingobacterium faecium]|uniref:prepilin peptidase n=1 Tax=Sphingobacterium faecium TaxID=34087 RepID=UPI001292A77D|nr:prepilin peptidase [Sphingobacterium faecium]MQP29900.1 hypothetical protein [Sphingobacterium faecium]